MLEVLHLFCLVLLQWVFATFWELFQNRTLEKRTISNCDSQHLPYFFEVGKAETGHQDWFCPICDSAVFQPKRFIVLQKSFSNRLFKGEEKSKKPAEPFLFQNTSIFYAKSENGNSVHCSQMKRHKCCCFCSDPQLGSDALMSARSNTAASLKKGFANSSSFL